MEDHSEELHHHWLITPLLGLLVLILLVVLVWFGLDVRNLNRQGVFSPALSRIRRHPAAGQPLTAVQIEGWMTFRYIDFIFNLPQGYLASKLNIADSNYLNMTLYSYAKSHKLDGAAFVQSARGAVAGYRGGIGP